MSKSQIAELTLDELARMTNKDLILWVEGHAD